MAGFCTKCGMALPDGSVFCTRCGNPTAAVSQAPVAPPMSPPPITPPQGTSALKIILIIVGVFIGIGILSGAAIMFGVWRIAKSSKIDASSRDRFSLSTPMGSMSMNTKEVTEAEAGAPLYPNAKRDQGSLQIATPQGSMNTYVFFTSDSPAQVIAFYRDKLGSDATYVETPEGGMITRAKGGQEGVIITVGRDAEKTTITIIRGHSDKAPESAH